MLACGASSLPSGALLSESLSSLLQNEKLCGGECVSYEASLTRHMSEAFLDISAPAGLPVKGSHE